MGDTMSLVSLLTTSLEDVAAGLVSEIFLRFGSTKVGATFSLVATSSDDKVIEVKVTSEDVEVTAVTSEDSIGLFGIEGGCGETLLLSSEEEEEETLTFVDEGDSSREIIAAELEATTALAWVVVVVLL